MSYYDIERSKQNEAEIRRAFKECFPLCDDRDLPWAACQIKEFLNGRIKHEVERGTIHFVHRVTKVLCEISPPKTHIEDMCRIVVERAKKTTEENEISLRQVTQERDRLLRVLSAIGKMIGCDHVDDEDGQLKIIKCLRETLEAKQRVAS